MASPLGTLENMSPPTCSTPTKVINSHFITNRRVRNVNGQFRAKDILQLMKGMLLC